MTRTHKKAEAFVNYSCKYITIKHGDCFKDELSFVKLLAIISGRSSISSKEQAPGCENCRCMCTTSLLQILQ